MCALVQNFEDMRQDMKGCLIDAAFAEQESLWENACHKSFSEASHEDCAILRKHIIENYYEEA